MYFSDQRRPCPECSGLSDTDLNSLPDPFLVDWDRAQTRLLRRRALKSCSPTEQSLLTAADTCCDIHFRWHLSRFVASGFAASWAKNIEARAAADRLAYAELRTAWLEVRDWDPLLAVARGSTMQLDGRWQDARQGDRSACLFFCRPASAPRYQVSVWDQQHRERMVLWPMTHRSGRRWLVPLAGTTVSNRPPLALTLAPSVAVRLVRASLVLLTPLCADIILLVQEYLWLVPCLARQSADVALRAVSKDDLYLQLADVGAMLAPLEPCWTLKDELADSDRETRFLLSEARLGGCHVRWDTVQRAWFSKIGRVKKQLGLQKADLYPRQ